MGASLSVSCAHAAEKCFSENFDSGNEFAEISTFGDFKLDDSREARAGTGKSLRVSTIGQTQKKWPLSMKFPVSGIEGGKTVVVKFSYVILGGGMNFAIIGGSERYGDVTFSGKKGTRGQVSLRAAVPEGKRACVSITSAGGSEIAVDDIEISYFPNSWLDNAKEYFTGMKFLPNNPVFAKADDPLYLMPKEDFFPFIDEYGQFKHRDWPGKIHSDADFEVQKKKEAEFNAKLSKIPRRSKWGGYANDALKAEGTGRFRLDKIDGKWTFRDPDGYPFWSLGIDCVNANGASGATIVTGRENYFEKIDPKYVWGGTRFYDTKKGEYSGSMKSVNFNSRNMHKKYGSMSQDDKVALIRGRLNAWGVNSSGAWSDERLMNDANIPFSVTLGSGRPAYLAPENKNLKLDLFWTKFPDYLHPDFAKITKENAARKADLLNSPYCIGAFVDNELPWQEKTVVTIKALLGCPASQPGKIEFRKDLQKKYGEIGKLNAAWKASYKDWEDFLEKRDFAPNTAEARADMLAFEEKMYEHYFKICREAVKTVSPDAMYIGCRFAWRNPLVERVASRYCDALSYNVYSDNVTDFSAAKGAEDKPIIIGEFHFGNTDKGVYGGGLNARATAEERAQAFREYAVSAFENPKVVGAHWFQWFDLCTTGRFNEANYAIGFVDICDTPDYIIAKAARKLSKRMYDIRMKGGKSTRQSSEASRSVIDD